MLGECQRLFANSGNTAARLARYNGLTATPLYHPPRLAERIRTGPFGGYFLSVGRLESVKRVDLAIRALAHTPDDLSLVIAGTGTQRSALEELASSLGVGGRIQFRGEVSDDEVLELYAGALGVIFPPYDEDFGYVTLEAFLAGKPVVTTTDAGGPNEFVIDGVNGRVTAPDPETIGAAMRDLHLNRDRARAFGAAGYERARGVTWSGVIEHLIGESSPA